MNSVNYIPGFPLMERQRISKNHRSGLYLEACLLTKKKKTDVNMRQFSLNFQKIHDWPAIFQIKMIKLIQNIFLNLIIDNIYHYFHNF